MQRDMPPIDKVDTQIHCPGAAMQQDAVVIKNAYKRYGKGEPPVLDGLNMNVARGCIYGLLGSSGCGKTTLLSCIVGVRKLDQGEVWVLGGKPGEKNSGIPGPRVGYMPQEVSLVGEFSIIGALYYFGRINNLKDSEIEERYGFFSRLLQLPPKDCLVKHLSGGQQRRVSFAASLLHKPELLLLDEPTVGLDPVLRENIWQFLVELAKKEGTAVVITTHYIEETKLSNRIGLLRCGRLLAETTPTALLKRFSCQRLEEAYHILSQKQEESRNCGDTDVINDRPTINHVNEPSINTMPNLQPENLSRIELAVNSENQLLDNQCNSKRKYTNRKCSFSWLMYGQIFRALIIKNLVQFLRHPGTILFAFIFPLIHTTLFFYAFGNDLRGIIVAVVNDEAGDCDYGRDLGKVIYKPDQNICDYKDISCRFLQGFDESFMVKQYSSTIEEATLLVHSGKAAATMYFGRNFSRALQNRRDLLDSVQEEDIIASQIQISLDMGDSQTGLFLQKKLYERFFEVHIDIVSNCNISKKYAAVPINFKQPVFGKLDAVYSDTMAPAFILTTLFFLATSVSSSIIITDRAEGVWDRSLVQGVTKSAILFSHILTQMLMIIIQVTVVLVTAFAYFELSCRGSFVLVTILALLISIAGMCYGFLISVVCSSQILASFIANGSLIPVIVLCGSIWPLEGMPTFLRFASYCMPITVSSLSLRGLLEKGFSIFEFEVYIGFCITIGWIATFVTGCLVGLRKSA